MTSMNAPTIALQDELIGEPDSGDTPSVSLGIPRAAAVTRACVFTPASEHAHPVLASAAALAAQHRLRADAHRSACDPFADDIFVAAATRSVNAADAACTVLVERVDMWAAITIAENRTGSVHTETFGQLVNRLVAAWTHWHLLDTGTALAGKAQVHEALHRVSELSVGYDDLVTDLRNGRRRLPRIEIATGPVVAAESPAGGLADAINALAAHLPPAERPTVCPLCQARPWPCVPFDEAARRIQAGGVALGPFVPLDLHPRLWPPKASPVPLAPWFDNKEQPDG